MLQGGLLSYHSRFFLKLKKVCKKGRDPMGRIVLRTVGSFYNKRNIFKTRLTLESVNCNFVIKRIYYQKFLRNKAIVQYSTGGVACIPTPVTKRVVGSLFFNNVFNYYNHIKNYKFGSKLSWLQDGLKLYSSSRGCFFSPIYAVGDNTVVLLPSGLFKFFNSNIVCFKDVRVYIKDFFFKRGAKLLKWKGKKPTVRGTVKNPNDHPNGGRTRSMLKYMTPWGKIVKKKSI